jgi:UDP-N-acetylglucosamine 3-dehydrogenase
MRTSIGGGYPESFNGWLDRDELGGGVILNLGIHALYFLISIFGKVKRVYSRRNKVFGDKNKKDYSLIVIRFEDDSIVNLELSWAYPDGTPYISKLDAFGTNGQLNYDDTNKQPIILFEDKLKNKSYNLYNELNPLGGNPYKLIIESLVKNIEFKSDVSFKVEDSIYALKVATCCLESANKNQVIHVK